ncbi:hypothetical protein BGZ76_002512 [Entomortierella beljakovae]|nr:hypothetical protein BGZ76_002512 [Entomortierella beljakovae]
MTDPASPNELDLDVAQSRILDTVTGIPIEDSFQSPSNGAQTETIEVPAQTLESEDYDSFENNDDNDSDDDNSNDDDDDNDNDSEDIGTISEESESYEYSDDDQAYIVIDGVADITRGDQTNQNIDTNSSDTIAQDSEMEDGELILEVDPSTGLQRAVVAPSNPSGSGRLRSSLVARLLRQHRRMTTPVRARPNSSRHLGESSRSAAGLPTGSQGPASQSTPKPIIDENAQSELRKKIIEIQKDTSISFPEKASMIQKLMLTGREKQTKPSDHTIGIESIEPTENDLKATYISDMSNILGCKHYQRGCKLKANCCGKWFNCRFCHDEVSDHDMY